MFIISIGGKYEPLWKYIIDKQRTEYKLTYEEIRNILGFDLDHSFLTYPMCNLEEIMRNFRR